MVKRVEGEEGFESWKKARLERKSQSAKSSMSLTFSPPGWMDVSSQRGRWAYLGWYADVA